MPRQPRQPLTLRDLAAQLGVSAKTVSNAYRHPNQLSAGLRERILAAAAERGYPGPNPIAAGLASGRVGAVGVAYASRLSYAFDDPVARELLAGMTHVTESAGAGLLLLPGSSDTAKRVAGITAAVIDGLLAYSLADDDPILTAVLARRLPLVVIDQPRPTELARYGVGIPWVGIDDRAAATSAADHLLELGHRRFGVISFGLRRNPRRGLVDGPEQQAATYAVTRDRLLGYRDALERHSLDWSQVPVFQGAGSTPDEGDVGATTILGQSPRPTALLCLSDRLAEGALRAARRLQISVPDDLSLVGFDDADPTGKTLDLTTIRQPTRAKGERAAQKLLTLIAGDAAGPVSHLPANLVTRGSTRRLG